MARQMITPTDDLCVSRDDLKYAFLIYLYCAYAFPRDDFCVTRDDFEVLHFAHYLNIVHKRFNYEH